MAEDPMIWDVASEVTASQREFEEKSETERWSPSSQTVPRSSVLREVPLTTERAQLSISCQVPDKVVSEWLISETD